MHLLGCYQLTCLFLLKPDTRNCSHERSMPWVSFLIYTHKVFCLFSVWLEFISSSTPFKSRLAPRLQYGLGLGWELCPFELWNISENGNSTASLVVLCNREPAMMFNYLLEEEFFLVSNSQGASWARRFLRLGHRGLPGVHQGRPWQPGPVSPPQPGTGQPGGTGEPQSQVSGTSLETGTGEGQAGPLANGWRSGSGLVREPRVRHSPGMAR